MKLITLSRGMFTQVSDIDYDWLNQWKWYASEYNKGLFYAKRNILDGNRRTCIRMHRVILGLNNPNLLVDHKDGNGLNNQRENIRVATKSQNSSNRTARLSKTSKYLGVHRDNQTGFWVAGISKNYINYYLGYFGKEEDAALAYNKAAIEIHGEFANLNIVKNDMA